MLEGSSILNLQSQSFFRFYFEITCKKQQPINCDEYYCTPKSVWIFIVQKCFSPEKSRDHGLGHLRLC